jgi:hypothetical protein
VDSVLNLSEPGQDAVIGVIDQDDIPGLRRVVDFQILKTLGERFAGGAFISAEAVQHRETEPE